MKQLIYVLAKYLGLFYLSRCYTRQDLRILAYHGIWLGDGHFGNFLYMSPEKFSSRMQNIKDWKNPVLSLEDALSRREKGTLPDGAVVITIDDGWFGTYLHMAPELIRQDFPATVYVTSYYVEKQVPVFDVAMRYMVSTSGELVVDLRNLREFEGRTLVSLENALQREEAVSRFNAYSSGLCNDTERQQFLEYLGNKLGVSYAGIVDSKLFHLMTLSQVEELRLKGIGIELHTHRHRISFGGESCLEQELAENRDSLGSGQSPQASHFCYPSGRYDQEDWPVLEKAGINSATTTGIGLVRSGTHRYELPRILDGEEISDIEFEAEISGFCDILRRIKSTRRR